MKNVSSLILTSIALAFSLNFYACTNQGCTNKNAKNFDEEATKDDGSCEFDNELHFSVQVEVDDEPVLLDGKIFKNAAGNEYEASRLQFYLSEINVFYNNGKVLNLANYHYYDLISPETFSIETKDIEKGKLDSIGFVFGLKGALNQDYALPNTLENTNMQWPMPMGGGYHFMKFEGKFTATDLTTHNFNVHMGRLVNSNGKTNPSFRVSLPLNDVAVGQNALNIMVSMNLNAWFKGDRNYDMNDFGEGIMGNHEAQALLFANGKNNVFKFKKSWEEILE